MQQRYSNAEPICTISEQVEASRQWSTDRSHYPLRKENVCIDKEKFCANINALHKAEKKNLLVIVSLMGFFALARKMSCQSLLTIAKRKKPSTSGKETDSENVILHISGFDALHKTKNKLLVPFAQA